MQIISAWIYCSFFASYPTGKKNKALGNISGREESRNFLRSHPWLSRVSQLQSLFWMELVPGLSFSKAFQLRLFQTSSPCSLWPQDFSKWQLFYTLFGLICLWGRSQETTGDIFPRNRRSDTRAKETTCSLLFLGAGYPHPGIRAVGRLPCPRWIPHWKAAGQIEQRGAFLGTVGGLASWGGKAEGAQSSVDKGAGSAAGIPTTGTWAIEPQLLLSSTEG